MSSKNLLVYNGCNRKAIDGVAEGLPQLDVIPPFAFVVESVDSGNGCAFVVAAEQEKIFRIFHLVRHQQTDRFQTLLSSIDVIS